MSPTPAPISRPHPRAAKPKALLRLSASRGKLALELAEPFPIGPLCITHLVSSLEGLRFPVDLSGGVARFRHRRGILELLTVQTHLPRLAEFLAPKARDALDSPSLRLTLLPGDFGVIVGVHDDDKALAFNMLFAPDGPQLRFVVCDARAVGFDCHAHAVALRLATTLCGPKARRQGSMITMGHSLQRLAREALLDAGARLPSCSDLHVLLEPTKDGLSITATTFQSENTPPSHVVRAIELARIAERADDALAANHIEDARAGYMATLEAAPRHPSLALRIAEIDLLAEHDPRSTLAFIVEVMPALDGGPVASTLLAQLGDTQAATVALRRAAEQEPMVPLAAQLLAMAARQQEHIPDKLALLDEALARLPSCTSIRWQRAQCRLTIGMFTDAIADFGQLEAATRGSIARFHVCVNAANMLMSSGLHQDARTFFEKALRYAPRSAEASAGLARAFFALGDGKRGVALLSRAVTLMGASTQPNPALVLDLARALADHVHDIPTAIFHVRTIPFGACEAIAARALEGRWRHQLDDLPGASHAFAQAREAASHLPLSTIASNVCWLIEAATFELDVRNDPLAAKRHAEVALHATPHDPIVEALFRRTARAEQALVQSPATAAQELPYLSPTPIDEASPAHPESEPAAATLPPGPLDDELPTSFVDESRIESLKDRVRANPKDDQAVKELCALLDQAERYLDLMALVSARLDETTDPPMRLDLLQARKHALLRLIESCKREGRNDEAEMYEMVLAEEDPIA